LENAYYIITPSSQTEAFRIEEFRNFIRSLGAIPMLLDYDSHDAATAAISHLPHVIASALVNFVENADDSLETMKTIAAGGFKDITRIASSSPVMWEEICMTNKTQILSMLAPKGSLQTVFELYCDLIDEAGGIATIATILASNHLNIKNIGILHNREFEEGVLKIEMYDQPSYQRAIELLRKYHYTVYER